MLIYLKIHLFAKSNWSNNGIASLQNSSGLCLSIKVMSMLIYHEKQLTGMQYESHRTIEP